MTERPALPKSADAYRTISEVAAELNIPQHVLRFWETRFPQVKPLKRAGGRRFYRPDDVALLRAIQALLYGEGYTIKGVQRLLAEHGARHVAESLARSRAGPASAGPGAPQGEARDGRDDPEPEPDRPVRREPAPPQTVPPRTAPTQPAVTQPVAMQPVAMQPVPPDFVRQRPLQQRHSSQQQIPQQPPPRSGPPDVGAAAGGTVIDRLAEVLADLDQSSRLLMSIRSTGD